MSFFSFLTLFDVGVDTPKPSEVETSEQLPTSSSNSEKQPTAPTDESKPGADTKLFCIYSRGSLNFIRLLRVVITPSVTSESTGR